MQEEFRALDGRAHGAALSSRPPDEGDRLYRKDRDGQIDPDRIRL